MEYTKNFRSGFLSRVIAIAVSVLVLALGMLFDEINQFLAGGILIAGAVTIYFFTVYKIEKKIYLSFVAVSNAVWIATIGLAQLRLLGYQKVWSDRTWVNIILASVLFQISIPLGHKIANRIFVWFNGKESFDIGR